MEIKGLSAFEQFSKIKGIDGIIPQKPDAAAPAEGGKMSFADFLGNQLNEVNRLGLDADRHIEKALTSGDTNPHETMIALQKADISFRLMLSVKEKLIQAYQQIVRTPIG